MPTLVNGKTLMDFIDSILSKEDYTKRKDTWYKSTEDCICFFSIGKSPFGGRFDHVMGCFIKELNDTGNDYPAYYKNDLKFSIRNFVEQDLVERVFNLENKEFKDGQREFLIKEFFDLYVMPFLNEVSTKNGIIAATKKHEDLIYYIKGRARKHLSI